MERGNPVAVFILLLVGLVLHPNPLQAQKESNVTQTVHNLSATGSGDVKTTDSDTEVCVFCHTPHGASSFPGSPLWNRSVGNNTYTPYTSLSLDAEPSSGVNWINRPEVPSYASPVMMAHWHLVR